MVRNFILAGVTAAGLLTASTASAETWFDFRNTSNSGQLLTSKSFTSGGITVVATAYYQSTPTGAPTQVTGSNSTGLGWWDKGLGVSNPNDSGNNYHTIDNVGSYDFILLTFSQPVQLLTGYLAPFDVTDDNTTNYDADTHVSFTYNPALNSIASPTVWANLLLHGTEVATPTNNLANNSYYSINFNPGMNTGNQWLIGASQLTTDRDDGFKLAALSVQLPVPEPATWAMMMTGFGIVGGGLRRRNRAKVTFAKA